MPNIKRVGDLEIAQDLDFQRRSWIMQRVGWVFIALVAVAALLGLAGQGPLSKMTAGKESELLSVEYDYFGRFQAPTKLKVNIGADAGRGREVHVWLSRKYIESAQIQQVVPEPERVEAGEERLTYVFQLSSSKQPTAVTFYLQPDVIGPLAGQTGVVAGQTLTFNQFIYP